MNKVLAALAVKVLTVSSNLLRQRGSCKRHVSSGKLRERILSGHVGLPVYLTLGGVANLLRTTCHLKLAAAGQGDPHFHACKGWGTAPLGWQQISAPVEKDSNPSVNIPHAGYCRSLFPPDTTWRSHE